MPKLKTESEVSICKFHASLPNDAVDCNYQLRSHTHQHPSPIHLRL
jgi:hypothetical protein